MQLPHDLQQALIVCYSVGPMINVQIERTNNENSLSTLRRFNKRVQGSGVMKRVRSIRYKGRNRSPLTNKKHALNILKRRVEVEYLMKLGKMTGDEKRVRARAR